MRCSKSLILVISMVATALGTINSYADDTEIFFGNSKTSTAANSPNILLILDTSGSMGSTVTSTKNYVNTTTYSGSCSSSYVYYAKVSTDPKNPTVVPNCSTSNKILASNFVCTPATSGTFSTTGYYQDNAIQWIKASSTKYQWQSTLNSSNATFVTCKTNTSGQYPVVGLASTSGAYWGGSATYNYWTTDNGSPYAFYNANYVNYSNDSTQTTTTTRMKTVQAAADNLIASVSNVNIGLARYNSGGNGGMVIVPVAPVSTNSSALTTAINNLHFSNDTPLTETLYEAYLYMSGGAVKYGLSSQACSVDSLSANCITSKLYSLPSAAGSRTGNTYKSPMQSSCQKNYIVYLTDGLPNADKDADILIKGLTPNSATCYASQSAMWTALSVPAPYPDLSQGTDGSGWCLKALTNYMYNTDLSSKFDGTQNVITNFIGFGSDLTSSGVTDITATDPGKYLQDAAQAGGGQAYAASDLTSLTSTFSTILGGIQQTSATFTAPSVAVNAFNKTQILEDLYITMFSPSLNYHWPGNAKKFKLRPNSSTGITEIVDKTYANAVDPSTGFLKSSAQDFWENATPLATDDITTRGGAAKKIPTPAFRNLYTYLGANENLADTTNAISTSNLTSLQSNGLPTTSASTPTSTSLINWIRGMDIDDDNNNGSTTDARNIMGDAIHSQPAVVIYGNDLAATIQTQKLNDALVYVATNDGYLHAFDVLSGVEKWAFIPQEFLHNMLDLYNNDTQTIKQYKLDGNIRVLRYDTNNDGVIDPSDNDRVFLYFSEGRGGDRYYGLDVTYKNDTTKTTPKFLWSLGTADLKKTPASTDIVKYSWSTPALARVNISGATQNPQKLVLIFAGGYDPIEDNQSYQASDLYGNGIFIVDAITGKLLWSQTYDSSSTAFKKMDHAIPSSVTVIDTNLDGYTDRMYVGDMAAQIWRFDITNGNAENSLVAGGVIASLGGKENTTSIAANRSFYNAPDVAKIISYGGENYYNIAIGSGDDALPKTNITTQDRFYSLRDYHLSPLTQAQYDAYIPIVESDLTATTAVTTPTTIKPAGWKIDLSSAEKILASSITINGVVMFTSYIPGTASTGCSVSTGSARAYSLNIATADKHFSDDISSSTSATPYDDTFNTTGLPSQVTDISDASIIRTDGTTGTPGSGSTCFSGVVVQGHCVSYGSKMKTVWKEVGVN